MFTGSVEALGTVRRLDPAESGRRLVIHFAGASDVATGESIAINGVCLTAVATDDSTAAFDVGPETLARTDLGGLQPGDRVNIERSLTPSSRMGGHFVQGHVDGVGRIAERRRDGDWQRVAFELPEGLRHELVPRGSVAVDGVSLTVASVSGAGFDVMLIPHTVASTTLGLKPVGAAVNIETDILGKYVLAALRQRGGGTS